MALLETLNLKIGVRFPVFPQDKFSYKRLTCTQLNIGSIV